MPQPLPHIIYQQLRLILGVQHREIVLPVCASGHSAVILILPQRLGYPLGHTAVKGIYAAAAVVVQHALHRLKAPSAALPDAGTPHRHDLVRPRRTGIHPLDAVLLEKQGTAQIVRRPSEGAVGATGSCIAVGAAPGVAVPILEIPQLTGIDLIDGFSVHHTVLAPPQPVAALDNEVHLRHAAPHRQLLRLGHLTGDHPRHHQRAVLRRLQHMAAVDALLTASLDDHAVPGGEAHADAACRYFYIGILPDAPAALAVLPQHRYLPGGVQPQASSRRVRRRLLRDQIVPQRRPLGPAERQCHLSLCLYPVLQTAVLAEVAGVDVLLVRPHDEPAAHANELFISLRQHQFRGHAADIQGVTVHPDQSILGGYAAGGLHPPCKTTPGPHRQGGIAVGGEILHLPEGAQLPSCPPIQP